MCSNASITEILGINDNNLVILGNKKENIKGIEYTVLRGKLSYRPTCCPKCGIVNENYDIIKNRSSFVKENFQKQKVFDIKKQKKKIEKTRLQMQLLTVSLIGIRNLFWEETKTNIQ